VYSFSQLLNQVDVKALTALLDEYGITVDTLNQLLENYIMNSTYDIVFFKITSHLKQKDWELAEAIQELRVCGCLIPSPFFVCISCLDRTLF
jgi:hypothetical protein